jgi:hypothetical protein
MDNSPSMRDHWDEARDLLKVLLKKCRKIDDDGVDILFTYSEPGFGLNSEDLNVLINQIDSGLFSPRPDTGVNISQKLRKIFKDYETLSEPRNPRWRKFFKKERAIVQRKIKPATLIFITDGQWEGCSKDDVMNTIKEFLRSVEHNPNVVADRPFTIEFIQLGEDPQAGLYLDSLDDKLCGEEGLVYVHIRLRTNHGRADIFSGMLLTQNPLAETSTRCFLGALTRNTMTLI